MSDLNERPHVLYRFFDARERLLYVGITVAIRERLARHEVEKGWYGQIARISVEHFPTREAVLAAEKVAIQVERPLHNIQHNGVRRAPDGHTRRSTSSETQWTFRSRDSGYERTVPLWLSWEVYCDPISDEFDLDEITAEELWDEWVRRYPRQPEAERIYGRGAVSIRWYVEGPGTFESAPFQDWRPMLAEMRNFGVPVPASATRGFTAWYTTPLDAETGERIRWAALPVVDKVWRMQDLPQGPHTTKGGFIQEATGWKPSALQPFVNVEMLARASGLALPSTYAQRAKGAA